MVNCINILVMNFYRETLATYSLPSITSYTKLNYALLIGIKTTNLVLKNSERCLAALKLALTYVVRTLNGGKATLKVGNMSSKARNLVLMISRPLYTRRTLYR